MHSRQKTFLILFVLLILGLLAGVFYSNLQVARQDSLGQDFKVYWSGARYFLLQNVNPYAIELAAQIRREVFGIPLGGEGYPHRLEYPFHILLIYLPFAWIGDINTSFALWMLVLEICLAVSLLFVLQIIEWRPAYGVLFLLLVITLLGFFNFTALLDGNASILLLALIACILFALYKGFDETAGILLAFSAFKWEAAGLLLLLILFWVVSLRRWNVLYLFVIGLVILLMLTTVLLPGWPVPYFNSVLHNLRAGKGFSTLELFAGWWPGLGNRPGLGLIAVLAVILFLEWRSVRESDFRRFIWVASLTLAAAPLIGVPIEPANLVLLIIPILLILAVASERWGSASWITLVLVFVLFAVPWVVVLMSDMSSRVMKMLTIVLPLCLLVGLYWLKWWAVHPPRVWVDRIRQRSRH